MLQQTQVATVLHYYDAFVAGFPTPASLARARPEDVLAAWAGLGYYRRARHLHAAARQVMERCGGAVPRTAEAFGALPGVGRYTAGAVLSIAFDQPLPVLDGNVGRVLSRLFAKPWAMRRPADRAALWRRAATLVPMHRPGDWNQAVMELGATICTPVAPSCNACPVKSLCRARALGRVAAFPPRVARRPPVVVRRVLALIERDGRVLVARREGTLLGGLWEPPGADVAEGAASAALRRGLAGHGIAATLTPLRRRARRVLTHRVIEASLWRGTLARAPSRSATLRWIDPARPSVPLTALARDVLGAPRGVVARTRRR